MGGDGTDVSIAHNPEPTEEDLQIAGQDHRRRVGLVARMMARDPLDKGPARTEVLAQQFGVSERTIWRDKAAIRAACGEKAENAIETVGETIARLDELWEGAIRDVDRVDATSSVRAAHRNTAMKALELLGNTLFRLGYWTEVPRRVKHSQDEEGEPVEVKVHVSPESAAATIAILDSVGARRPGGGDPGGDPAPDEVYPSHPESEAGGIPGTE